MSLFYFSLYFSSLFLLSISTPPSKICRGLALQGGPNQGAYQAGALAGLVETLSPEETAYDVITGVSMGAVNAAWASQFPKGQEHQMVNELVDFWLKVHPRDVYKEWPGGYVQGMFYEPSLFNTEPGEKYLKKRLTEVPKRYLAIGATNMNTGTFKAFNNFHQNLQVEDLLEATMASVAVPGLFPFRIIDEEPYFDGSVIKSLDIASIINQCRFLNGNDDTKIVVDVIIASDRKVHELEIQHYNALRVLMRTRDLMSFEKGCIALIRAKQLFPEVKFRYIVKPSKAISLPDLPLNFKHKEIEKMIKMGRQDAKTVIGEGDGVSFDKAIEEAIELYGPRFIEPKGRRSFAWKFGKENDEVKPGEKVTENEEVIVI